MSFLPQESQVLVSLNTDFLTAIRHLPMMSKGCQSFIMYHWRKTLKYDKLVRFKGLTKLGLSVLWGDGLYIEIALHSKRPKIWAWN